MITVAPSAGWALDHGAGMSVREGRLRIAGEARAYLVRDFKQRGWSHHAYLRFDLTDPLTFDLDLNEVPCGCVASIYLVKMKDPTLRHSNYCDAAVSLIPGLGDETCTELDLVEANQNALQSAIHTQTGTISSFGSKQCDRYGCFARTEHESFGHRGSTIDTRRPFEVRAEVKADGEMIVTLSQADRRVVSFNKHMGGNPQGTGVPDKALKDTSDSMGEMALVASLWKTTEKWLDGEECECKVDDASFELSNLRSIQILSPGPPPQPSPPGPRSPPLACAHLACQPWCSARFKEDHCRKCACRACSLCGDSPPPPPPPSPPRLPPPPLVPPHTPPHAPPRPPPDSPAQSPYRSPPEVSTPPPVILTASMQSPSAAPQSVLRVKPPMDPQQPAFMPDWAVTGVANVLPASIVEPLGARLGDDFATILLVAGATAAMLCFLAVCLKRVFWPTTRRLAGHGRATFSRLDATTRHATMGDFDNGLGDGDDVSDIDETIEHGVSTMPPARLGRLTSDHDVRDFDARDLDWD